MRTFVSRTIRSAFIGQERFQAGVGQTVRGSLSPQAAHGRGQALPGGAPQPLVLLHRQHDANRPTFFCHAYGRVLNGIQQTTEPVLGFSGSDFFHRPITALIDSLDNQFRRQADGLRFNALVSVVSLDALDLKPGSGMTGGHPRRQSF